MKIQTMCWVTSLKVAISNVKHKIFGLAHPARVPTPNPIYRGKCAHGQKFRFLSSASKHIMWLLIWKLMLHKNVTHYLIYTPWKLLHHFMLGEKRFLQRKSSHSISSSDKTFPEIAKFIRKWFLFQYTWWKF